MSYLGDANGASGLYGDALRAAEQTTDRSLILMIKVNAAGLQPQPSAVHSKRLTELEREAEQAGLKNLAIECAFSRAVVSAAQRNYPAARKELELVIARSENLGLRTQMAKAHHLLGTVLDAQRDPAESSRHFSAAQRILDQMRKEEGGADVLKRADLGSVYSESVRRAAAR